MIGHKYFLSFAKTMIFVKMGKFLQGYGTGRKKKTNTAAQREISAIFRLKLGWTTSFLPYFSEKNNLSRGCFCSEK